MLYTAGLAGLAALLFGLAPAFRVAKADVQDTLKAHGRAITSGHLRLPRLLVGAQMALCLTVLVAAGLLGRSLATLRLTDLGFDRTRILYASVNPWQAGLPAEQVGPYVERLRSELSAIPGVERVATIGQRPLSGSSSMTNAHVPGRPYREDGGDRVLVNDLGDGLVETLGYRVLAGRSFDARDFQPGSKAVLVDERFVKKFYPGDAPLGQAFRHEPRRQRQRRDRGRDQQQPLPEPPRRRPGPDHLSPDESRAGPGAEDTPGHSCRASMRRAWPRPSTKPRRAPTPRCP